MVPPSSENSNTTVSVATVIAEPDSSERRLLRAALRSATRHSLMSFMTQGHS